MSFSNYLEKKLLDHVFAGVAYTAPSAWYVSLHSASPGDTGASELAVANGYLRQATTFATATGTTPTTTSNAAPVTFTNTGADWVPATHFCVWDAVSAGNCLGIGALTTSKTIGAGDTGTFGSGELDIELD